MDFKEFLSNFCAISPNAIPVMNPTYVELLYEDLSVISDENICEYTLSLLTGAFHYFRFSLMSKHNVNYEILLKWCELYVSVQYRALSFEKHWKNQVHSSVPEVLNNIIEFLQYEVDEIGNYYSVLLVHLELLIRLAQEEINYTMKDISRKTVIHLWNIVLNSGSYSTQFRALKVMVTVIGNCGFDEYTAIFHGMSSKQSKILTDEIHKVITEDLDYPEVARKFLNMTNIVLNCERTNVFSLHCLSITFGERYRFIRSNNGQRLWIDFNFRPGTISFIVQRIPPSSGLDNSFHITLKIISMKLDEGKLIIYYVKPYVLPVRENLSKDLNKCNRAVILIPMDQYQRILGNSRVLKHFHCDMTNISVLQGGQIPENNANKKKDKTANNYKYFENNTGTDSGSDDGSNLMDDAVSNRKDRKADAKFNNQNGNEWSNDSSSASIQTFDKPHLCSCRLSRSARKKANRAAKAKLNKAVLVEIDDNPTVDDDTKECNANHSKGKGRRSRIAKKIALARK